MASSKDVIWMPFGKQRSLEQNESATDAEIVKMLHKSSAIVPEWACDWRKGWK